MAVDDVLLDAEERMEKAVEVFAGELRVIRTGTASAGLVENIRVDYYGSPTPIRQLAQIAIPDPTLIVIKPYDPGATGEIEKAIHASDIGINPQNDGKVIRLSVPGLSEERRQQIVSQIKGMAEEARVAIRNIRRDANQNLKSKVKEKAMTEDEERRAEDEIQKLTDQFIGEVDELAKAKEAELMEV